MLQNRPVKPMMNLASREIGMVNKTVRKPIAANQLRKPLPVPP
jgi:hypothetical protein